MKSSSCGVRLLFISSLTIGRGKSRIGLSVVNSGKGEILWKSAFTDGTNFGKTPLLNRRCSISAGAIVQRIEQAFPKR